MKLVSRVDRLRATAKFELIDKLIKFTTHKSIPNFTLTFA